ncbi:MAG: helix-turn-helix transcriptional regulator [Elusimicrobia bacterium]|nr:helix-turn-helix transcriptional regulator [Elusimicrobiota bacterium]
MIRNEKEYKDSLRRLDQDREVIKKQRGALDKSGLAQDESDRAMEPLLSFHQQLVEEVEWYERVKRQEFEPIMSITQIGRLLIALRIASNLSQRELARCLGVSEAQVSRDERNEYHGISIERATKILNVFGAHLPSQVKLDRPLDRRSILAGAMR